MTRALVTDQASATTGWAVGDSKAAGHASFEFGSIKTPKRESFGERLAFLHATMVQLVERYEPDLIGLESPFFPVDQQRFGKSAGQPGFIPAQGFLPAESVDEASVGLPTKGGARFNAETVKQLQKVAGCIETVAALYGIPCEFYAASSWRKTLLGSGRAPAGADPAWMKRVVRQRVTQMGYAVSSDDESDAIGILHHALFGPQAAARAQGDLLARMRMQ